MNVDGNVITTLEEDTLISSNYLEEKRLNDGIEISDIIKKQYDFSVDVPDSQLEVVLQAEAEKENEFIETENFITDDKNNSDLSTPIWILVNKKSKSNRKAKSVNAQLTNNAQLGSGKIETVDDVSYLSDEFDSITNNELITLRSVDNTSAHNNISNTRNVPNILRGPKILSKSNTSSPIPFEMEDNYFGNPNALENDIFEKEKNRDTKTSHRKRKQIHNPLVIQEDSMNSLVDTIKYRNKSMEKNKFNLKKTEKCAKNCQKDTNSKKKPLLRKERGNKISSSPTPMEEGAVQNSSITTNVTTGTYEETKDQTNDINLSSEFNEFYKEQFHEDYMDHVDILRDALNGYQDLNDSYNNECYDMNSNETECSKVQYGESHDYDTGQENEYSWENTTIESNYLSDYEDYFDQNYKFITSAKNLESADIFSNDCDAKKASIYNLCDKSCLSSFLDDSSDDEFCLKNIMYNDQQNSFNKDETRNLDTLLLEQKKCETNLKNHLNNDLNSTKINFGLINDTKNTTTISLSNGLEHSTTVRQDESKQRNDQSNVLLNTDLSPNISSDYPESTEPNDTNLSEENIVLVQKSMQGEAKMLYNYTIELNYENEGDKHPFQMKSNESTVADKSSENISKPKIIIETLQCIACALTFTSKRTLALHVAGAHGGMYVILCERCGRLFNKKCLFNRHFIHCGCVTLPFGCKTCNKTYRHRSSLMHHLKAVHKIEHNREITKLYKCNVCSKVYRKYRAFEKHLGTHIKS